MNQDLQKIIQYGKENNLSAEMIALLIFICLENIHCLSLAGNGWFDNDEKLNDFFNGDVDHTKHESYLHWAAIFPGRS